MIDSHCHLDFDYSPRTVDDLLREARIAGLKALITVGTELDSIQKLSALSDRFTEVFHTAGIHPHEAKTLTPNSIAILRAAAQHPKCRAIGEIGLDFHYNHSSREEQQRALELQLELARELKLPVVIHSREAEADLLPLLKHHSESLAKNTIPGVLHCFSGTASFGEACLKLGYFISFSGILTFKKATDIQECAKQFPLDRLLIETDSPFLAPVPFRGKKCEPSMVRLVAEKLAEIKEQPLQTVIQATTENANRVFRLD